MSCLFLGRVREKIWKIMKLTVFLIVFFVFSAVAEGLGQEQNVTLKLTKVSLYELFDAIHKQTGLRFLYNAEQMQEISTVDVDVENKKVKEVLADVLAGSSLTFKYDKDVVMLVKRTAVAQQKSVKIFGLVTDEKKAPLPGVTVMVKGLTVGTATDKDGKYRLQIPNLEQFSLVFSFVGMETVEVKYQGKDTINVVMKEELNTMEEVVVTGYQNINRRDMVGSYNTMKGDDIMMPNYNSLDQMLQGRMAGMIVMNTSSRVGTSPKIQIRGASTLLGNTDPLWVVDGIIQSDPITLNATAVMTQDLSTIIGNQIAWLNPQDVETITVLKDASATAIYGSKASNGVIVITTKRGKVDRMTVNYTGNFSFTTRPTYDRFNLMNSQERVAFTDETIEEGSYYTYRPIKQMNVYEGLYRMFLERDITEADFLKRKKELESVNTNWLKLLTRNAFSHKHSVSVSGGSEKFTYNASIGYSKENGQEIGNDKEMYTGRIAFNTKLRKNITLDVTANGTSMITNGFGPGVNPMDYALSTSRAIPAYDGRGDLLFYQNRTTYTYNGNVESLGYNIINERDNSGSEVRNFTIASSVDFKWEIISGLTYQFTGGYSRYTKSNEVEALERTYYIAKNYRGYDYGSKSTGDPEFKAAMLPYGGSLYTNEITQASYNVQNKLLYTKTFNTDHRINVMLGMEVRSNRNMTIENMVWGYMPERGYKLARPTDADKLVPINAPYSTPKPLGPLEDIYNTLRPSWGKSDQTDNYFSWFGTLAYSYKNRYVLNANIRNDISNRFGQDVKKRLDPTYSFGLLWRVTEESFMESTSNWINNLAFRVTYGIQGNALSNKSMDLILKMEGVDAVYNQYYSSINDIPNPHLSWERTTSWNLGVDLELFKIFNVTAEYYTRSSNAIVSQDVAYEYGKTSLDLNGGMIDNKGMEFTVAFTPVRTKDFAISVSLNSSKNWNKAKSTVKNPKSTELVTAFTDRLQKEGYPVESFWSFSFKGLSPEDGRPLFNYFDVPEEERDANMDPTKFMVWSGQKDPYFTGGLNLGIRYKGFTLNTDFALLLGGKKRLPSPYSSFMSGKVPDSYQNLSRDLLKRWKRPGDELKTNIPALTRGISDPRITAPDNYSTNWYWFWANSDVLVVDASFLRCRGINLTWNMPLDLCKQVGIKTLALSATVNNVFVIASKRFDGFDPELSTQSVIPQTYSLGINIGF